MRLHKQYTSDEDATLLSIVKKAQDEGIPLATAYIKAADELGRAVKSVSNRHGRLINPGKKSRRSAKSLSEGELLALKLKAIKRDNERNAEKSNMYKERYADLEKEHTALKKKYDSLLSEHENLIKTVKEVLGEDEDGGSTE